jgi:hypothetical protein
MLRWKSSLKPAAAAANDYRSTILADSPVAYYRLGESSGTTASDETGNYDATYANSPTLGETGAISGDSNTSVLLASASSQYAEIDSNLSITAYPFTIEAWVKTTATAEGVVGSFVVNTANNQMFALRVSASGIAYTFARNTSGVLAESTTAVNDGNWHHIVAVFAASNDRIIYVDGAAEDTHAANVTLPAINRFSIGRLGDTSPGAYFTGTVDEVAVYDTALSASTILAHYNAGTAGGITLEGSAVTTGTSFSTPTNIDVNIPAVSTNDILILFVSTNSPRDPTSSPPSGWTKIAEQDGTNPSDSTVAAYWKRASSGSTATTETWSSFFPGGAYYYIWVGAYSGCVTSGSPVDAYGTATLGYSSSWSVNVTTNVADTMIVTVSGTTQPAVTQTWTDGTELIDTAYQSVAAVSINEKLEATSGAKTRTSTPSFSTSACMIAVALKPA